MKQLVLSGLLVACTGSSQYWIAYVPPTGVSAVGAEETAGIAVRAIHEAGKDVDRSISAKDRVVSHWFTGGFSGEERFRLVVSIDPDANYEVDAECQRKEFDQWNDGCGNDGKLPRFVVEMVTKIDARLRAMKRSDKTTVLKTAEGWWCSTGRVEKIGVCVRTAGFCEDEVRKSTAYSWGPCFALAEAACFHVQRVLGGATEDRCTPTFELCHELHAAVESKSEDFKLLDDCKATK